MVFQVSSLGPSCSDTQNIPSGSISRKKHLRTEEGDNQDNTMLARGKRVRKNNSEGEAGSSSSDNIWFVAFVTALNLLQDALYLPKDFTSSRSNGFRGKCCKIVLTDGGERSWEMDLRFNKSSDKFYITRGWRKFCDENGKKAESFFTFELTRNGDTPSLSFCPTESINDKIQEDENNSQRCGDSTLPNQNIFLTLKLSYDSLNRNRLYLSRVFLRKNGMENLKMITLVGKDGIRRQANLLRETSGRMSLGKGWKNFAEANGLKIGESFTFESIWKDKTHVFSLSNTNSESDGQQQEEHRSDGQPQEEHCSEGSEKELYIIEPSNEEINKTNENIIEERSNSASQIESRLITLSLVPEDVKACTLYLPSQFMRANGIDKVGKIILLGKDRMNWCGYLLSRDGTVAVGIGWRNFCEANGVRTGESFTLEFINKEEEETPVFKFCPSYS